MGMNDVKWEPREQRCKIRLQGDAVPRNPVRVVVSGNRWAAVTHPGKMRVEYVAEADTNVRCRRQIRPRIAIRDDLKYRRTRSTLCVGLNYIIGMY